MPVNTWHVIAVSASAGAVDTAIKIYYDSTLDTSTTIFTYFQDYPDGLTGIGVDFDFGPVASDMWTGFIWEVKLFNYAISMPQYLMEIKGSGWPFTAASVLPTCSFLKYDNAGCVSCNAGCTNGCVSNVNCYLCDDLLCIYCTHFATGNCVTCATNASPVAGVCQCDTGYFALSDACVSCHSTCLTCSSSAINGCLSCKGNAHLVTAAPSNCLCDSGFAPDPDASVCSACHSTCLTCTNLLISGCSSCKSSAHLAAAAPSNCVCDNGYAPSPDASACSTCANTCLTCSTINGCLSCKANAHLQTAAPSSCSCNSGFAPDPDASICSACHNTCLTCSSPSISGCSSCKANAHLVGVAPSSCDCDPGYTPNPDASTCPSCDSTCLTCSSTAASGCLSCKASAHLAAAAPSDCVCDLGFNPTPDASYCITCDDTCLTCANPTLGGCVTCRTNAHLAAAVPSNCVCDNGYAPSPDASACSACANTCLACSTINGCLSCKANAHLQTAAPSSCSCDSGFAPNPDASICSACHNTCLTCSSPSISGCTSCKTNAHLAAAVPSNCVCDNGYAPNPDASACSTCANTCLTCSTINGCLSCKANAHLQTAAPSSCLCDSGFAPNPDASICSACHNTCLTCSSPSISGCSSCKANAHLIAAAPSSCACNVGLNPSPDASFCIMCSSTCLTCSSTAASGCLSCKASAHLAAAAPSDCVCDSGFNPTPDASYCIMCDSSCLTCANPTTSGCVTCRVNALLVSAPPSSCTCRPGFFPNPALASCSACHITCESCTSADNASCTACKAHAHLFSAAIDRCDCDTGYYPWRDSSNCLPCNPTCQECVNGDSCVSCSSPATLSSGSCLCPEEYTRSNDTRRCVKCDPSCRSCTEFDLCTSCRSHARLYASHCTCESSYWSRAHVSSLSYCTNTSYFLIPTQELSNYQENCIPQAGSFEGDMRECVKCPAGCSRCASDAECLQCETGWFMHSNQLCGELCEVPNPVDCRTGYTPDHCFSASLRASDYGIELIFSANLSESLSKTQISVNFSTKAGESKVDWNLLESAAKYQYLLAFNSSETVTAVVTFLSRSNFNSEECFGLSTTSLSLEVNPTVDAPSDEQSTLALRRVPLYGTLILTLAVSAFMSQGSQLAWTLLLNLQFESYLPMTTIALPKSLRSVLIDTNPINSLFNPFTYFQGSGTGDEVDLHFKNEELDSYLFLENVSDLTAPFAMLMASTLFLALCGCTCWLRASAKVAHKLKHDLPQLIVEGHLTICMALFIQIYSYCYGHWKTSSLDIAAGVCAILSGCVLVFISIFFYSTFLHRLGRGPNGEHSLFFAFRPLRSFSSRSYYVWFSVRRLVFCGTQVFLCQYPMVQGVLNVAYCLLVTPTQFAMYLKLCIPFQNRLLKAVHILSELLAAVATVLCQCYLLDLRAEKSGQVHYSVIAVMCAKAAVLLIVPLAEGSDKLKSLMKRSKTDIRKTYPEPRESDEEIFEVDIRKSSPTSQMPSSM